MAGSCAMNQKPHEHGGSKLPAGFVKNYAVPRMERKGAATLIRRILPSFGNESATCGGRS